MLEQENFWLKDDRPVFALAPMEDVTDTVFRELILAISGAKRLNVVYTEFTNVDGMMHPIGKEKVGQRLIVSENEKAALRNADAHLVAQVWGNDPEVFYRIVREISGRKEFSGIDINMGCPDKNVVKSGACSALIAQPELAREIICAAREASPLPLSVKTRTGIRLHTTEKWISHLLGSPVDAIILHARTQKQQSNGFADWDQIRLAAQIRNAENQKVALLGNGDVRSYKEGCQKAAELGIDGIMVGRGIFRNPWFFAQDDSGISTEAKLELMHRHIRQFQNQWEGKKSLFTIKRYLKIYANGFSGASELRGKLMRCVGYEDLYAVIADYRRRLIPG